MAKKADLNRVGMPRLDPLKRASNFEEVATGYTLEMARYEASRCLFCEKPVCIDGCPVGIDIPNFIHALMEGDLDKSAQILKEKNTLPRICGRVCPQETQCEIKCVLAKKKAPIAIGRLERFVGDWEAEKQSRQITVKKACPSGFKAAVVGGGPAGLTCAAELAKMGHEVTLFEALHRAGGVLVYGIPQFRLPEAVVRAEVENVIRLGVNIDLNTVVGRTVTIDELMRNEGYKSVFVGCGAGSPVFLNIPGENLNGVYSANEFLTRINMMKAEKFPLFDTPVHMGQNIAVIGGGNVAMDAARTALRLGAQKVRVLYRRSEIEMPARVEEVECARQEGIEFMMLTAPLSYEGDTENWVKSMRCTRMELGEPDAGGRRSPIPLPGSEFSLTVDMVITALGTRPNPIIARTTPLLSCDQRRGTIRADENGLTDMPGVWAGGDIVTGAATVISAMGAGKTAAKQMDKYMRGLP